MFEKWFSEKWIGIGLPEQLHFLFGKDVRVPKLFLDASFVSSSFFGVLNSSLPVFLTHGCAKKLGVQSSWADPTVLGGLGSTPSFVNFFSR